MGAINVDGVDDGLKNMLPLKRIAFLGNNE
jgi:hypothetical protein